EAFVNKYEKDKGWRGKYARSAAMGLQSRVPGAIGAGARHDAGEVQRVAKEQARKQLHERIGREDMVFEDIGGYDKGATYWEETAPGVWEAHNDLGRAMTAVAR